MKINLTDLFYAFALITMLLIIPIALFEPDNIDQYKKVCMQQQQMGYESCMVEVTR